MKIKNIILVLCTSLTFCSCSDWLDVSPNNQVDGENLFNSGNGYRIALNGIYKQMSSQNLWGEELTWGMADVLGQQYTKSNLGSTDSNIPNLIWEARTLNIRIKHWNRLFRVSGLPLTIR